MIHARNGCIGREGAAVEVVKLALGAATLTDGRTTELTARRHAPLGHTRLAMVDAVRCATVACGSEDWRLSRAGASPRGEQPRS